MSLDARYGRFLRMTLIFMLGLYSLAAQSLLFRAFLGIYDGSELGIGAFFGSWLLWIAIGAALSRRLLPGRGAPRFELLILLYLPAFLLQEQLIVQSRQLAGVTAYEVFPLLRMMILPLLINCPTSLLTGLLFPLACNWVSSAPAGARDNRQAVARTYIYEALGAFAGGSAITLMLWSGMPETSIYLYASLAVAAASALYRLLQRRCFLSLLLPLAIAAVLLSGLDRRWNEQRQRASWNRIMEPQSYRGHFSTKQTPYLYGYDQSQFNLLAWGSIAETVPQREEAAAVVAATMAQHPQASRVLVIGTGSYSICKAFGSLQSVSSVTWLTDDPEYTLHMLRVLPREYRDQTGKLRTPPYEAKRYLIDHADRFDLVLINLPNPDTLLLNRYFTTEFYSLLKGRMPPDGVLAVRTDANENFIGGEMARIGASVYATLRDNFEQTALVPGEDSWLLGSDRAALTQRPGRLRNRFRSIPGATELYPPEALWSLYRRNRASFQLERYAEVIDAANENELINSDQHPKALMHTLMLSLRRQGLASTAMEYLLNFSRHGLHWMLAALLLYIALRYRRGKGRGFSVWDSGLLVSSAGFAALTLSVVAMFAFQSRFGSIYLFVGLLSSLFMLGLYIGGSGARLLTSRHPPARLIMVSIGLHILLCIVLAQALSSMDLWQFILVFLLNGVLSGVYLPVAARQLADHGVDDWRAGGILDACDHLGGTAGAFLAGIVMLPLLGALQSLLLIAALLLANLTPCCSAAAATRGDRADHIARRIGKAALFFGLIAIMVSNTLDISSSDGSRDKRVRALSEVLLPGSVEKTVKLPDGSDFSYYEKQESGDLLFETGPLAPDIRGYNAAIEMAVLVNSNGVVITVEILQHRETPYYMRKIEDWIGRLAGSDIFRPGLEQRVDTVSGATVSSEAILESLAQSGALIEAFSHGRVADSFGKARHDFDPLALLLLGLVPIALWIRSQPSRRLRRLYLAAVLLIGGIYLNAQYSIDNVVALMGLKLPAAGWNIGFLLTVGTPLLALFLGNIYCGYLCPFGALQELLGDLTPASWKFEPPKKMWRYAGWLKYLALFAAVLLFSLGREQFSSSFDPLLRAFGSTDSLFGIGILALLLLSIFFRRFWCRNLCPTGAFLALLNRFQWLRFARRRIRPGHCDLGVAEREQLDCINCDRCRMPDSRRPGARRPAAIALYAAVLAYLFIWTSYTPPSTGDRMESGTPAREAKATQRSADSIQGEPRDADMGRIEQMIRDGRLSEHEALYYEQCE